MALIKTSCILKMNLSTRKTSQPLISNNLEKL
jgi:hypothetical protein